MPEIPLKNTACAGGCGIIVQYRTNPKVLCVDCRTRRRAEQARIGMEKQRRKRGVPEIKGQVAACVSCGVEFTRNRNAKAMRCGSCAAERSRARARAASLARKASPEGHSRHTAWYKAKRLSDPAYAINFRFRAAIRRCVRNPLAASKWEKVGYRLADLMAHLERQFLPGMSWENRRRWEIDHIVPLSKFSFASPEDPEFKAAWALTNLRPIWAQDNRTKNRHRTHLL